MTHLGRIKAFYVNTRNVIRKAMFHSQLYSNHSLVSALRQIKMSAQGGGKEFQREPPFHFAPVNDTYFNHSIYVGYV
jgi:hypothetical protein